MSWPATYYKNRSASTRPCLLCQTRTKGRAKDVYLGYGVTICLCDEHASDAFIQADNSRHFLLSVHLALRAAGRLTRRHVMALDGFVARARGRANRAPTTRKRPGSYTWAAIRQRLEARLAASSLTTARMVELVQEWLKVELRRGLVKLPSLRTLRRWRLESRWLEPDST